MNDFEIINPSALGAPRGYSHGVLAPAGGRVLAVAGQIAWDRDGRIVTDEFPGQFRRSLGNALEVVRGAGGGPEHVIQLTIFVVDKNEYVATLKEIGAVYRTLMGSHYPAMALVEVAALLDAGARVEIQALAVVPPFVD